MVAAGGPGSSAELPNSLRTDAPTGDSSDVWLGLARKVEHVTERFQEAGERFASCGRLAAERLDYVRNRAHDRLAGAGNRHAHEKPVTDPMTRRQRRVLALATALVMGLGSAFLSGSRQDVVLFSTFVAILGGSGGLVVANRWLIPKLRLEGGVATRLMMAVPAIVGMAATGPILGSALFSDSVINSNFLAAGASLLLIPWDKVMAPNRRERVILGQAVAAGLIAFVIAAISDGLPVLVMGWMAGIALVAQIASPFGGRATVAAGSGVRSDVKRPGKPAAVPPPLPGSLPRGAGGWNRRFPKHAGDPYAGAAALGLGPAFPLGIRIVWLCFFVTTFGLGLFWAIATGFVPNKEVAFFLGGAIACGTGAVSALIQLRSRTYYGWWGSLVKPLLRTVSMGVAIFSGFAMSEAHPGTDDVLLCAFFIGFPAAIWLTLLFIPNDLFGPGRPALARAPKPATAEPGEPGIDRTTGIILTCLGLFGVFGLQRLCVGKIWTGLLYFFTGGLLLIGQIYDLLMLASGEFTDKHGRKIRDKSQSALTVPAAAPVNMPMANVPVAQPVGDSTSRVALASEDAQMTSRPAESQTGASPRRELGSSFPRFAREPRRTSLVLSALAYAVLIPGVLIGAAAVLQVPGFVAISAPDLAAEISQDLGPNWPTMSARIGIALASILLVFAALLLVIARREAGGAHMARGVLGIVGLFITGVICQEMLEHIPWLELITEPRDVIRIETALNSIDSAAAVGAMITLLISGVILAWPERRRTIALDATVREGVAV
jgi:hypothetical protein